MPSDLNLVVMFAGSAWRSAALRALAVFVLGYLAVPLLLARHSHGASLVQSGKDATVVAIGRMVPFAQKAAAKLAAEGISFDLIDLRSTSPIDEEMVLESLSLTGRLVVVDESNPICSIASEVAAIAAEKGFPLLRGPVRRVTAPHTPVPFARELERMYVPGPDRIEAAIRLAVKGE